MFNYAYIIENNSQIEISYFILQGYQCKLGANKNSGSILKNKKIKDNAEIVLFINVQIAIG